MQRRLSSVICRCWHDKTKRVETGGRNDMIKVLDLFCGAGGCSEGYSQAGLFVTGVDIVEQIEYPFDFILGNSLDIIKEIGNEYDLIHASPPCQHFTKYNNCRKDIKERYEDLIEPTRKALKESGKYYVIENVERSPLLKPVTLCGSMFGLDVRRHRLFESNFPIEQLACDHSVWKPNRFPGGRSRERGHARVLCRGTVEVGRWNIPIETQKKAMGVEHINNLRMLSESIPPAYTKYIGEQFIKFFSEARMLSLFEKANNGI